MGAALMKNSAGYLARSKNQVPATLVHMPEGGEGMRKSRGEERRVVKMVSQR